MNKNFPKIGVGVIIKDNGKVLLGKRISSHGSGTWQFPGGHLEFGEGIFDCAKREVKEEAGIDISNLEEGDYTNDFFERDGKHFVTLYVIANNYTGTPKSMEPEKCEYWDWFEWDKLPQPLMLPVDNLKNKGYNPF